MGYRETAPPRELTDLVETAWAADGGLESVRVLPDGCMDLIAVDGRVVVAGPDVVALITSRGPRLTTGLRFRPGALPRLLGVPAARLVGRRIALDELSPVSDRDGLVAVAGELSRQSPRGETAPWSSTVLRQVTAALGAGRPVEQVARDAGWSHRTLQRQCQAVYGYGPATLRRILRFRRAAAMLQRGQSPADVAAVARYADQPHLHREVRSFAGVTVSTLASP